MQPLANLRVQPKGVWKEPSVNWVCVEQHFSKCDPWNFCFARRFHGQINLDKHCVFLLGASIRTAGTACWESACPSEGNDLCDSCSGQTETWGLLFVTVAPPGSQEAVKAVWEALSISSCEWTWPISHVW